MNTKPKKFCFVLMPFESDFDDIYKLGIKQSCIDAGAYCERVNEQIFNESILERIYNQISKADIIIADMTGKNPNVFYEVGYAHALGKTTILLTKNADDIPFDLKHYPHIVYNNSISTLKEELTKRVKWCVENDRNDDTGQKVDIDIYLKDKNLSNKNIELIVDKDAYPTFDITLYSNTFKTFSQNDYSIGVITDINYVGASYSNRNSKTTRLPDGRLIHMCPVIEDALFPNSCTSFVVILYPKRMHKVGNYIYYEEDQEITIRIFTPNGTRDFFLQIKYKK